MKETLNRIGRTLLQLIAAGGLTALTDQVVTDVPAAYAPYLVIGYTLLVTAVQNALEDAGKVKPILKPDVKTIKRDAFSDGYVAGHEEADRVIAALPRTVRGEGPMPASE